MVPVLDPGRHGQGPVEGAGEGQGSQKVLGLVTEAACERRGSGGDRTADGSGTDRGVEREPHRGTDRGMQRELHRGMDRRMQREPDRGMQRGAERGPHRGMKGGLQHRGSHRGV